MPSQHPSDPWADAGPTPGDARASFTLGLAATALTIVIPGLLATVATRGDDAARLVVFGVVLIAGPALLFLGLVVAPLVSVAGLALWWRARALQNGSRLLTPALLLNLVGFLWWGWLGLARIVDLAGS